MSDGTPPPADPYGQPPPYSQPPHSPPPHGQPPYSPTPYGQPPYGAAPYPPPYGTPPYGGPQPPTYAGWGDPDKRPGTVLAAGVLAIVGSVVTALLTGLGILGLVVARDEFLAEMREQPEFQDAGISGDAMFDIVLLFLGAALIWSLVGGLLGWLALRRSVVARVLLVISSAMVLLLGLLMAATVLSLVWVVAAGATIVLLFTGGANDWYAHRTPYSPH